MAQQGSGLGKGPDGDAFTDQTSFNARAGAAKQTQKSFETKWGMKDPDGNDETNEAVGPVNPGSGPDASSGNPLDPQSVADRGKRRAPADMKTPWGMTGADGKGLDNSIGGRVIGEAILSGSAKLPTSESYSSAGPGRKPG